MNRTPIFLALALAAPAFARDVRGRVSHTEEGSDEARKLAGGAYVLRMNVVTETGDVVTLNAQEGVTKVFEGSQLTKLGQVRAQARVKAVVDDDCKLATELCVASQIEIEQVSGLTRIEAVKERAAIADADRRQGRRLRRARHAGARRPLRGRARRARGAGRHLRRGHGAVDEGRPARHRSRTASRPAARSASSSRAN